MHRVPSCLPDVFVVLYVHDQGGPVLQINLVAQTCSKGLAILMQTRPSVDLPTEGCQP